MKLTPIPWYERDPFWEAFEPILFDDKRWQSARREVAGFVALSGINPGDHVLDLCCGPGRHSLALAAAGFAVTAVDRTRSYLDGLARRAEAEGLPIAHVEGDMLTFLRPGAFDAILCAFTSFGYFAEEGDNLQVLRNARQSLRDGGHLVLDVIGKEIMARGWTERYWTWLEPELLLLEERAVEDDWRWVHNTWTLIRGTARRTHEMRHRLYAGAELAALLGEAGFEDVRLFGSWDGAPYDRHAERLIAVAR